MQIHVNITNDFSLGALTHDAIMVPMPKSVINASVEMIATQYWPPGFLLNQNKFALTVMHKNQWIVQSGHDCGALIPDTTIPIVANLLYAVNWPFSSRKIVFSAMTVLIGGAPAGCADTGMGLPMMTCGDPISAPTALVANNWLNTVYVGMTPMDVVAGIADIAVSIILTLVFRAIKIGEETGGGQVKKALTKMQIFRKIVYEELVKKLVPTNKKDWIKKGVSVAAGFATSSLRGNPTAEVVFGTPVLGVKFSLAADKGLGVQWGAGEIRGDAGGVTHKWGRPVPKPADPEPSGSGEQG